MSKVEFLETLSNKLADLELNPGRFIFTTDTKNLYIDTNTNRINLGGVSVTTSIESLSSRLESIKDEINFDPSRLEDATVLVDTDKLVVNTSNGAKVAAITLLTALYNGKYAKKNLYDDTKINVGRMTVNDDNPSGSNSAVCGGSTNIASGTYSAILGGNNNISTHENSVVAGGYSNEATDINSFIGGGEAIRPKRLDQR